MIDGYYWIINAARQVPARVHSPLFVGSTPATATKDKMTKAEKIAQILGWISKKLTEWVFSGKTGKLIFEINLSQGGIGVSNVRTEGRLEE